MAANKGIFVLAAADLVMALLAVASAHLVKEARVPTAGDLYRLGPLPAAVFVSTVVSCSFLVEGSDRRHAPGVHGIGAKVVLSLTLSLVLLALLHYPTGLFDFGLALPLIALVLFGLFDFISRTVLQRGSKRTSFATKVVIIGCGAQASTLGKLVPESERNYVLSGFLKCADEPEQVPPHQILRLDRSISAEALRGLCDKIVVSLSERRGLFPLREVMACKLKGIEVVDAPAFYEELTGKLLLEAITPSWFIFSDGFKVSSWRRIAKRWLDVTWAALGIVLTLPLLPLAALAIKLDSPGPVFFAQKRVGEGERLFTLYKFRTMKKDAESATGAKWAIENDPRVTRIGRIFRQCRIDEFPQFYNVLKGDMSLVGPRPERQEFVEKLKEIIPYYSERHAVKPGVTGWAQVRYRYGSSAEDAVEKLRYDLYYVKNLSLVFDLTIIFETVAVVIFGRGSR